MGTFKEIEGDLIESFKNGEFDIIAHGCNCFATFGAGIALTIGKEFPEAKDADKYQEVPEGEPRLGKFTYADIIMEDGSISSIFNLYTQLNPGRDFRFDHFKKSIKLMREEIDKIYVDKEYNVKIGFPLIGCGIAGGDWKKVRKELKREFKEYDVTTDHFNQVVEGVNYWPKKRVK